MAPGSVSLGLGEYLTLWAIIGVVLIGVLGWAMGTGAGGAVVFIILGIIAVMAVYAILARVYRFLLHGSISAKSDSGGGDTL